MGKTDLPEDEVRKLLESLGNPGGGHSSHREAFRSLLTEAANRGENAATMSHALFGAIQDMLDDFMDSVPRDALDVEDQWSVIALSKVIEAAMIPHSETSMADTLANVVRETSEQTDATVLVPLTSEEVQAALALQDENPEATVAAVLPLIMIGKVLKQNDLPITQEALDRIRKELEA